VASSTSRPLYRLIGFLDGDFGLSVAARNTERALKASGREVERVPLQPSDSAAPARVRAGSPADAQRGAIDLFQMNPLDIGRYSAQWRLGIDAREARACVPFWELPLVPRSWEPMLRAMDVVLAPTRYIADACAPVVGEDRVVLYPQAVFLPEDVHPDRSRWGIPREATTFIVSFDIGSDVERKNPWAAIDAFQLAFPDEGDVRLVVKTKPWPHMRAYRAQAQKLAERVASDSRIQLIDESLTYADVLQLYASCDVMISLHRSEGLGLHLMEAMSLGVVVVGTGWSGNVDFMTPANSVLVPYQLVPVKTAHSAYLSETGRDGQVWAEADARAAASELVALREDPERRIGLSRAAAADMDTRRRDLLTGRVFDDLETALTRAAGARDDIDKAIRRAHRTVRVQRLRDKVIAVQRRLGHG